MGLQIRVGVRPKARHYLAPLWQFGGSQVQVA
jgi:hypothetical protein